MIKVILTKGLPASGKSTWAKEVLKANPGSYKRVNKDDLRAMMDNSKWSNDSEKFVLKIRDEIILNAVQNGKHVIVDDTNFATKHTERIKQLVHGIAEVVIQDFCDVPIETCIERDLKRCNSVGEKVIRDMYNQFLAKKEVYNENPELPKAIIVDIDGTLAKMNGRSPYAWDKVSEDTVNKPIRKIVNNYPNTVIIFSGRDGICLEATITWLNENNIKFYDICMRPAGNNEKDSIIKRRMFEENIRGKYFIEFVLDDRKQVVDMWREMGLTCLQVADGNF